VRPSAFADVGRFALPEHVPDADLDGSAKNEWRELHAVEDHLREAHRRFAKLELRKLDCERDHCGRLACLDGLLAEARKARTGLADRRKTLASNLVRTLEVSLAKQPSGGGQLALGWLIEGDERAREDGAPSPELKRPIELYTSAKANPGASADVKWWAGYLIAHAASDQGDMPRANAEFQALAALPEHEATLDVLYRLADNELDSKKRAEAFRKVTEKAKTAGKSAAALWSVSAFKSVDADLALGQWRSALATAADLARAARSDPDASTLLREAEDRMVLALDALGVREGSFPSVPADSFARVGKEVAVDAEARFDPRAAALAWTAVANGAPDTAEGREGKTKAATVVSAPNADALTRLRTAARACGYQAFGSATGGEIEITVDAMTEGRGTATTKNRAGGDEPIANAATCLRARAPAYFVGANASARATIVYVRR
jgi:hypothetical protein